MAPAGKISEVMHMKILLIGGTGVISSAISERLIRLGHECWILNRGTRALPQGAHGIVGDIRDEAGLSRQLEHMSFDAVADFLTFNGEDVLRDFRLFHGRTRQYIGISSASAFQTPLSHYLIDESTPLYNPYWQYSRDKIACEEMMMKLYREEHFPITIVRPSHTYNETKIPLAVVGDRGSYPVIQRIREGKPVIIPGDGTSLWTVTHSRDFAVGFVGLLGNMHAIGESVNIVGDEVWTWNQIYQMTADAIGVPLKAVHVPCDFLERTTPFGNQGGMWGDKSNSTVFDNRKLKRLVPDFRTNVSFAAGVKEAVEYIFSHPECMPEEPALDDWFDRVISAQLAAEESVRAAMGRNP